MGPGAQNKRNQIGWSGTQHKGDDDDNGFDHTGYLDLGEFVKKANREKHRSIRVPHDGVALTIGISHYSAWDTKSNNPACLLRDIQ